MTNDIFFVVICRQSSRSIWIEVIYMYELYTDMMRKCEQQWRAKSRENLEEGTDEQNSDRTPNTN